MAVYAENKILPGTERTLRSAEKKHAVSRARTFWKKNGIIARNKSGNTSSIYGQRRKQS